MANTVTLDFRGAPPSNGTSVDYITPGQYNFVVTKAESKVASTGSNMVVVSFKVAAGPERGHRLVERFTLPKDGKSSLYGLQRLHAFCLACKIKVSGKKIEIDLDKFVGRSFDATVKDVTSEAKDDPNTGKHYDARTASGIDEFIFDRKEDSKPTAAAAAAVQSVNDGLDGDDDNDDDADSTASETGTTSDDDDDDADGTSEPEPPALKGKKKAPPPPDDDDEDEDPDSLFA